MRFILITSLVLAFSSCGKNKNQSPPPTPESRTTLETIVVEGDPSKIIEGSVNNTNTFFSANNIEEFENYSLNGIRQFTKDEAVIIEEDLSLSSNENEENQDFQTNDGGIYYSFRKQGHEYVYSSLQSVLTFTFSTTLPRGKGKLNLNRLQSSGTVYETKVIHYSQNHAKDAFSLLVEIQSETDGKVLLSFVFVKKIAQEKITVIDNTPIIPWNQYENLKLILCGEHSSALENTFKKTVSDWNTVLKDRLNLKAGILKKYPPFSDLNTHCLYTFKRNSAETLPSYMENSLTLISTNTFKGKIFDSDSFIWINETDALGPLISGFISRTIGLSGQIDLGSQNVLLPVSYLYPVTK